MNYELAKKLKEAGFPQPIYAGINFFDGTDDTPLKWMDFFPYRESEYVKIPTLSELIEACGQDFVVLKKLENGWYAASDKTDFPDGNRIEVAGWGTPEEAVANLWLSLHAHEAEEGE